MYCHPHIQTALCQQQNAKRSIKSCFLRTEIFIVDIKTSSKNIYGLRVCWQPEGGSFAHNVVQTTSKNDLDTL